MFSFFRGFVDFREFLVFSVVRDLIGEMFGGRVIKRCLFVLVRFLKLIVYRSLIF